MTNPTQAQPSDDALALAAAQGVLSIASSINPQADASASGLAALFDAVGPSEEFKNTKLIEAGVTAEELDAIKTKINTAIANKDMQTINMIAKAAVSVLGGVKDILF